MMIKKRGGVNGRKGKEQEEDEEGDEGGDDDDLGSLTARAPCVLQHNAMRQGRNEEEEGLVMEPRRQGLPGTEGQTITMILKGGREGGNPVDADGRKLRTTSSSSIGLPSLTP
jgi:hypothetical protein